MNSQRISFLSVAWLLLPCGSSLFLEGHFGIHLEVASDSLCFLINSSWLLVFTFLVSIHSWFSGILIFFFLMATAFMGYVLPFGQMSFWGATVITNLLSPFPSLIEWVWRSK